MNLRSFSFASLLFLILWLSPGAYGQASAVDSLLAASELEVSEGKVTEAQLTLVDAVTAASSVRDPDLSVLSKATNALSWFIRKQGYEEESRPVLHKSLEIFEAAKARDLAAEATVHEALAYIYFVDGDLVAADNHHGFAFERFVEGLGSTHFRSVEASANRAFFWCQQPERRREGIGTLQDLIANLTARDGEDGFGLERHLSNLGLCHIWDNEFGSAVDAFERAIRIAKMNDSAYLIPPVSNLGILYQFLGELTKARSLADLALELAEKQHGPESDHAIRSLLNKGRLQFETGDFESSRSTYDKARLLSEEGSEFRRRSLFGVGDALSFLGSYEKAEAHLLEAVAIDSTSPAGHLLLGNLYANSGKLKEALNSYDRSLSLTKATDWGSKARTQLKRGMVAARLGDSASAAEWLQLAEQAYAAVYGPDHPEMATVLSLQSNIAAIQGKRETASRLSREAAELTTQFLQRSLGILSFAEQTGMIRDRLPLQISTVLSHGDRDHLEAYGSLLGWKGLLTHSLRRQQAFSALSDAPQYKADVASLRSIRLKLGQLFRSAEKREKEEWIAETDSLTSQKEAIEYKLASALNPSASSDPLYEIGLDGFRSLLKDEEAFADIYRYTDQVQSRERYAAVITSRGTEPRVVDLGWADETDRLVAVWRSSSRTLATSEIDTARESLWAPIFDALPSRAKRIWVSPDSELARISWRILANTNDVMISLIDDARSLVALRQQEPIARRTAMLVGGLKYGTSDLPALPATTAELKAIQQIGDTSGFRMAVITDTLATRDRVLAQLAHFSVVHLATHGFFGSEEAQNDLTRGTEAVSVPLSAGARRNPLIESGIYLSASKAAASALTAEDLVGVNLNADLVVLSACDTGQGTEITGQGVQGLRSSLLAAGARSILMSLWKVPDEPTALLMTEFYTGLWQDRLSKDVALRRAQEKVMAQYPEPVNWAAWILAGDIW